MESIDKYVWYQEGPGVRKNQYTLEGIKLLNVANLVDGKIDLSTSDRYISKEEANGKYKHFLADEGDLVIASSGIQVNYFDKKMGFIKKEHLPLCMNTSTIRFKVLDKNTTNIRYFMYFLKSDIFKRQLQKLITGSAQLNFGPSHLKKIKINMPLLENQNKEVNELDKVQEIIDIREKQIEQLDELIKSQFVELFGNISEYERLENYAVLITKGASPKWQGINYQNDGTLFVTSENVREGFVDISKPKYLDNKINEILPRSILKRDDILINIVGASIGRAAKYDYDYLANINQAVALVRTQNINNIFLLTYLNSDGAIKMYDDMKKGGARENLSLKNIADLRIPKASIELQNQFAEFVKLIDKQKFEIQKSLEEMEKLQESLMNKYFG